MGFILAACPFLFGLLVFLSPRQALCSLVALTGAVVIPMILFSGVTEFKREGGMIAGMLILISLLVAYLVSWLVAHLLLPKTLFGKISKKAKRTAGVSIMAFSFIILAALLLL